MSQPCIRCGDCQVVCPVDLKPQLLHATINAKDWKQTERLNLDACLFCNACTAACPSEIQLNTQFRDAHDYTQQLEIKHQKSLLAKQRFDEKSLRTERKLRLQSAQREKKLLKISEEDKQAAIAAALARAQRKYQDA